jgi:hypothetical protein
MFTPYCVQRTGRIRRRIRIERLEPDQASTCNAAEGMLISAMIVRLVDINRLDNADR